jgi:hypothetical protein
MWEKNCVCDLLEKWNVSTVSFEMVECVEERSIFICQMSNLESWPALNISLIFHVELSTNRYKLLRDWMFFLGRMRQSLLFFFSKFQYKILTFHQVFRGACLVIAIKIPFSIHNESFDGRGKIKNIDERSKKILI